jgi:hypothetical protein
MRCRRSRKHPLKHVVHFFLIGLHMNTPRSRSLVRFDQETWRKAFWEPHPGTGSFSVCLDNEAIAVQFSVFLTSYVHLEDQLEHVLAELAGIEIRTAQHIMRAIVSVSARLALLKRLLERSARNAEKPVDWDQWLEGFLILKSRRNAYVHGRWVTDNNTGIVYLSRPQSDPFLTEMFLPREEFDGSEFSDSIIKLSDLTVQIHHLLAMARDE